MKAGVACLDVTPPLGLAMAGFAARTAPAQAVHDALTVRALVVDDTALLVADVIGLDAASCARIRAGSPIPKIVVAATHTHGGPAVMPDRLSPDVDPAYLARLEAACVQAVCEAAATALPCRLVAGMGANPGIARNRRHAGGIVDPSLPVLRLDRADGSPLAVLVAYACHPTVLGPDNLAWTGDYPHAVRRAIEAALPGATCLFLTGCAGDVNVGHAATASYSAVSAPGRTFAEAERIGRHIAACALAAELSRAQGPTGFATAEVYPRSCRARHRAATGYGRALAAAGAGRARQGGPSGCLDPLVGDGCALLAAKLDHPRQPAALGRSPPCGTAG